MCGRGATPRDDREPRSSLQNGRGGRKKKCRGDKKVGEGEGEENRTGLDCREEGKGTKRVAKTAQRKKSKASRTARLDRSTKTAETFLSEASVKCQA